MKIEIRLSLTSYFLHQRQFCFFDFELQNYHNLLNEIFYVCKAVNSSCLKLMCSIHYIMQCHHCIMWFLIWLCVLFMVLHLYISWFYYSVIPEEDLVLHSFHSMMHSYHSATSSFYLDLGSFHSVMDFLNMLFLFAGLE